MKPGSDTASPQHNPMKKINIKPTAAPALDQPAAPTRAQDEIHDNVASDIAMSPALTAAMVVDKFHAAQGLPGGVSISALAGRIERSAKEIQLGDLREIEALLLAQAHALNSVFTQYALRSASAATQDRASELLLLAIKAQAASRATLATLVDLKLPRQTVIARQANLAQGHQQVVNQGAVDARAEGHEVVSEVPTAALAAPGVPTLLPSRVRARKSPGQTVSRGQR